jgi:hypothetical protein
LNNLSAFICNSSYFWAKARLLSTSDTCRMLYTVYPVAFRKVTIGEFTSFCAYSDSSRTPREEG